jgi:hypothetical protein
MAVVITYNNRLVDYTNAPYVAPATFLLDIYTGAIGAWSLIKLRTAYIGNCIKVRRSSDNTSLDIGFINDYLDTASLLSFVGVGDGFVSIWYDQSGNGYNFEQPTLDYQPKIVNAGSLLTKNSKPTVVFDGLSDYMSIPSSLSSFSFLHKTGKSFISTVGYNRVANEGFILCNNNGTSANIGYLLTTFTTGDIRNFTTNGVAGLSNATVSNQTNTAPLTTNSLFLINDETDNGNATASQRSKIYVNNGNALSLNTLTNTPSTANATADLTIGSKSGSAKFAYFDGGISQLIIYNTAQSSNRTGITTAINQQFSIY